MILELFPLVSRDAPLRTLRMALCTETTFQQCFLAIAAVFKPAARSAFKRATAAFRVRGVAPVCASVWYLVEIGRECSVNEKAFELTDDISVSRTDRVYCLAFVWGLPSMSRPTNLQVAQSLFSVPSESNCTAICTCFQTATSPLSAPNASVPCVHVENPVNEQTQAFPDSNITTIRVERVLYLRACCTSVP